MKNNQLMVVNKDNIFYRIKMSFSNFINKMFGKKQSVVQNTIIEEKENKKEDINQNNNFYNDIKNNVQVENNVVDKITDKKDFLKEIDGNVELLQCLSIDRLKQLEKYYETIIEDNNMKISKLSSNT